MNEYNDQFPLTIMSLFLVPALALYIFLIVVALRSDRPIRNLILVLILGFISIPFIRNKSVVSFYDQARPEDIKHRLSQELKLSAKEIKSDHALISDLRIPFPEVESVVRFVSRGYDIDPSLIIIENDSTLEEIANQINQYHTQDLNS